MGARGKPTHRDKRMSIGPETKNNDFIIFLIIYIQITFFRNIYANKKLQNYTSQSTEIARLAISNGDSIPISGIKKRDFPNQH